MYVHKSSYQSSAEAVKFEETLVLLPRLMISEFDTLASQKCIYGSDTFFFKFQMLHLKAYSISCMNEETNK
jgi:hypothetical protein